MTTLDKTYQPHAIEQSWYQTWENKKYFSTNEKPDAFSIMLPPPNVTGSLHMGHGFGFTLMDIIVRYQRMSGKNTLWQAGTDHAGIATQMVVERQLNLAGTHRHELGREKFLAKVWEWKKESGGNITRQARRLGSSMDWQREKFTMDEKYSYAVREVFIQLFNEGLIYRGTRLVNWDPVLLTAVSDLEVINQEEQGHLWHIRYPLAEKQTLAGQATHSQDYLVVATTRPETMLGDVAVAVHPDDERYKHLVGKQIKLPLTDRLIPIIADHYVDPTFGTGCVKITPAHDFNDYEVGLRHQLIPINIFTTTATLNENAPMAYRGLDRFVARKQILKDLTALELLDKTEKHILKVPRGEKSEAIIEPLLTQQWFMKMAPLAKPAITAVEKGEIRFIPENWTKTFYQWMNNIQDWCISRQLWWGHRIPIWYDEAGNSYAGHNEQGVRERYELDKSIKLTQDNDVLDTWFSSGLWPFVTLGWPEKTLDLARFFPTDLLITGFDIIFFWVARMIMLSLKFTGEVPFREVYITGLIRDADGHKMSKSKGNVLDPIDLIDGIELEPLVKKRTYGLMQASMKEKIEANTRKEYPQGIPSFGTDALRFTFCSMASYTREIRFDMNRLAGYRNFCNKLWNAARYVMMNTVDQDTGLSDEEKIFSLADQWILSRLQQTIATAHETISSYRYDLFAQGIYDFIWNEFCDWYLELSKPILTDSNSSPAMLRGTRYTLVTVLETLLRLLHPIMPYITEELWQRIAPLAGKTGESIMLAAYPQVENKLMNASAEQQLFWLKNIIIAIRTIRSEMNIAPGKLLSVLLRKGSAQDKQNLTQTEALFIRLAKIEKVQWLADNETPPPSATAFLGELEIYIPMAGFMNVAEEAARLNKEIMKCEKELAHVENKLQNPHFADKAPTEVVAKEREKQAELKATLVKLMQQKERQN